MQTIENDVQLLHPQQLLLHVKKNVLFHFTAREETDVYVGQKFAF